MSHDSPHIFCARLTVVILVMTGRLLLADEGSASSGGYKTVSVNVGGKTVPIRVLDSSDPFKNLSNSGSTGKYDPTRVFSATSSMADKSFALPADASSKGNTDFKNPDQNTFITKAYVDDNSAPTAPNLDTKASFPTTSAYSRSATGFDRSYPTSTPDAASSRTATLASATSTDQGRTAAFESQPINTPTSAFADKTFQGPEADAVHHHLTKLSNGQMLVTDLPNRPLTIDEVRDLINHGFKPNTEVKPPEASKPLNDPDYKPEPLRDTPAPASSSGSDDDKNDPVPAPGTMASPPAPENSEPLPQP